MTAPEKLLNTTPIHDQDWRLSALCAQTGGDVFFPEKGHNAAGARKICARCDVREECLADALLLPSWADRFGVRGGLSPRERDAARRQAAA